MPDTVNTSKLVTSLETAELKVLGNNVFSVGHGSDACIIEVLSIDLAEKSMSVRSNHCTYQLVFKDELDLVLDKMGIKRSNDAVNKDVKAPMPGKVLEVLAKVGDKLSKGDNILILEAMKMENVIKAEGDCIIRKIHISSQENVEKNQVLVELDFSE